MEAARYLRKSRLTTGMETDETLERHRTALDDFARRNGLHIIEDYSEVATGESLYARPEMLRLLADIEEGKYEAVLCMDLDRLSRGRMHDQGIIMDTMRNAGCKIITPDKTYDLNDEMDDEHAEFKAFISRREYKAITKRMMRGKHQAIKEGCYVSNAPYGYQKVTVDKKPTLEIVEHEAAFVRTMFDLYESGVGCHSIARHINALGAVPRRSPSFNRTSVARIISSPTYCGKIVWNQVTHIRKGSRGNAKSIAIYNPSDKWIITEGLHPAIITQEQYNRVRALYKGRYHPPSNDGTLRNPFAGLLKCGRCGGSIQLQSSAAYKGGPRLMCIATGCAASTAIGYVEERLLQHLTEMMIVLQTEAPGDERQGVPKAAKLLTSAQKELQTAETQKAKLYELLERGVYDIATFRERMTAIKERIAAIEKRIAEHEATAYLLVNANNQLAAERISSALKAYDMSDIAEKNRILKDVLKQVIYEKEKKTKPKDFTLYLELHPSIFI